MARLLGIRIKNYRALADVGIGQVKYAEGDPLPPLSCFIGRNGSGKSTLLDAFGFLADCLLDGVEAACDKPGRGGFDRLRTQGSKGPIELELFFDAGDAQRPIVYDLAIDAKDGIPVVVRETLRQRRSGQKVGKPYYFLTLKNGRGKVWSGTYDEQDKDNRAEKIKLADASRLGIGTLGNLEQHPRIVALRRYVEQWYLSYFVPEAARTLPPAGPQRLLDRTGGNVANVLQYFERTYKPQFKSILKMVAKSIPGLNEVTTKVGEDKRLLLRFDEQGYVDPFYQHSMSDGTLKMVAYAVLLADPEPRPFIGIEEPENGLYVELVEALARNLGRYAGAANAKTQILVTTHSPYFVDALKPEQVFVVSKDKLGHSRLRRASEFPIVQKMADQGIPLGSLWYSRHFEDGAP
jgi:predicted ATPase